MQQYRDTPNQPPKAGQIGYRITDQVEVTELDANGKAVRGVRVSYTLDSGPSGSVFVPDSMYTVANVQAAVAQAAGIKAQIHQLTG